MKRLLSIYSMLPAFLLGAALCSNGAGQTAPPATSKSLALGLIATTHQREIEEHFRDFAFYLSRQYHSAADAEGKVVVAASVPDLAKLLEQSKVDFFLESPYPTYVVNQVHGAGRLLLRRWKSGMAEYRSLIATRKDSGISRLEGLRGKIIAFKDPESTSGYFLPKFFLQRNGFKLKQMASMNAQVPATEVGYIFADDSEKLFDLIFAKQVASGAISDDDFARLDDQKKASLTILSPNRLATTPPGVCAQGLAGSGV